jgi:hypothetical protein
MEHAAHGEKTFLHARHFLSGERSTPAEKFVYIFFAFSPNAESQGDG